MQSAPPTLTADRAARAAQREDAQDTGTTRATSPERPGVWFVYDGECPLCSMAAHALRIQRECGPLHLIDARTDSDAPLLADIKARGLDLDEGMVIWWKGQFYHGADALKFMARFGDEAGWMNRLNRRLFQSGTAARYAYPWMRAVRNLLLKVRRVNRINNLSEPGAPIFKAIFGEDWDRLPPVMKRHYANQAFRNEVVTVEGFLDVESSPFGRLMRPLFRLAKALVPYEGKNVPVTVDFVSDEKSNAFQFQRTFRFPQQTCRFLSAMIPVGGNEVVEMMGLGLGWRMAFSWDGHKVILAHRGYVWRLLGFMLPIPMTLFMGAGYAEEIPVSDDEFAMMTEIRHPLWGRVFGYRGAFRITKDR